MNEKPAVFERPLTMVLLVLVAFAMLAPFIRFEVNDDVQMLAAASGATTGGAGMPQLMFVSSVFGQLLVLLYAWTRDVEWYGVLMATLSLFAVLALGQVFLAMADAYGARARRVAIAGTVVILAGTVLTMQYTRVGILLAFAGTLLVLCDPAKGTNGSTDTRWKVPAGALLILLAFMCRFEAAALGLLLATPAALVLLRQREEWRGAIKRVAVTMLIATPIVLGHMWLDQRAYVAPAWVNGLRYFHVVRPFADYHLHLKICKTEECARRSGIWTANDFRLLDDFIYVDPVVYAESNFKAVAMRLFPEGTSTAWRLATRFRPLVRALHLGGEDATTAAPGSGGADHLEPGRTMPPAEGTALKDPDTDQSPPAILLRILKGAFGYAEFALFCFMLALAMQLAGRRQCYAILGYVGWVTLLLATVYLFAKSPPPWVVGPFWLVSSTVLLLVAMRDMAGEKSLPTAQRVMTVVMTALSLYVVAIGVHGIKRAAEYDRSREEFFAKQLPADAVLVTSLASFPMESLWLPFGGNASVHAHRWLLLGWMSGTPVQTAQLSGTGISRPLLAAACGQQALFLGSTYHVGLLETFTRENAGGECRLSPIQAVGFSSIWHGDRVR